MILRQKISREQNDEVSDTTKMPKEPKLVTKDCFGSASQDDSPKDPLDSTAAGKIKII